jgi:hypothetical protein
MTLTNHAGRKSDLGEFPDFEWFHDDFVRFQKDGAHSTLHVLTDNSYAKLLGQLSDRKFDQTSPELRVNILDFYSDLSARIETKKDQNDWEKVLSELDQLKSMTPIPTVAANPAP